MLKSIRVAGAVAGLCTTVALAAGCAANSPQGPNADAFAHGGAHPCVGRDFHVDLNVQPPTNDDNDASQGNAHFLIAVTNTSNHSCTVDGYLDLSGQNAAGESRDIPVQDVKVPGPPVNVTIKPGQTAFAGMTVQLGDPGSPATQVLTGFSATVPGARDASPTDMLAIDGTAVQDEQDPTIPVDWVQVGTLQPTSEGVFIN